MKSVPTIQKYMTTVPHTIGFDQPLVKVEKMMSELRIRHLPVLNGGKLVGIFTWVDALKAFDELLSTRLRH